MATEGSVGPSMPSESLSGGQMNQSTPLDQRAPDRITSVGTGPIVGDNDNYLPAKYERSFTNTLTNKTHTVIVEDR